MYMATTRIRRWTALLLLGLGLSLAHAQSPAPDPRKAARDMAGEALEGVGEAARELAERKAREDAREAESGEAGPTGDGAEGEAADGEVAARGDAKGDGEAAEATAGEADGAAEASKDAADLGPPVPFTAKAAPPLPTLDDDGGRGKRAIVIAIEGTIDMGLAPFVERIIAESTGAAVIILDVDTFGGRVDAAVKIRDALLRTEIPVVAFVDNRAISAGALISLAADHIVFAPGGSMGAATPVQLQGGQAQAVEEKTVSYMRSEMRATAEANGRPGVLAEAMVDADVAIEGVIPRGKLLTVTTDEAVKLGLAAQKIGSVEEILTAMGLESAEVRRPEVNWAEKVARFLTDPVVSGLLMSLGMLGLLLEFYTPGFGITGGIGVMCLMLFFGGSSIAGLAGWEEMVIFALGIAALGVEVFVLPGFGVAGVLGIGLIGASLVMALIGMPMGTSWEVGLLGDALGAVIISLLGTTLALIIVIRYLPGSFLGKWLVLEHTLGGSKDGTAPGPDEPWQAASADNRVWLGKKGVALTPLRPSGRIRVGDDVVDVVSRDRWIDRDTPVKVVETEGVRVVVIEDEDAY